MYQNLTNEMQNSFKPLMNIFEIQSNTAQQLMREQMAFASECLDVSTRHTDTLHDSRDATAYFRVPVETSREISQRWMNAAGRQWNILMEAGDALNGEVGSAARKAEATVDQASREAAQKADSNKAESTQKAETTADKAESTRKNKNA